MVFSSVAEAARTKVKWIIGMKRTADGEGVLSESKIGDNDTLFIIIVQI